MQRRIAFALCSLLLLLTGCPKDNTDGSGPVMKDSGTIDTSSGNGGATHSNGSAGSVASGSGGTAHMQSGSGGDHGSMMGVDAGSGHPGDGAPSSSADAGDAIDAGAASDGGVSTEGSCDVVSCKKGTHCESMQTQCKRAPCPQVAACVNDSDTKRFCGGIAAGAFPCPGLGDCVDDPSDSCDPKHGGADCGGICECDKAAACVQGMRWNGSADVCNCEPDDI